MDRLHVWWDLGGPSSVINKIVQAIGNRERVLCLAAPNPRPAGLAGAIERRLRSELSLECATLDVSREDQADPIPHVLAGAFGISAVGSVRSASSPRIPVSRTRSSSSTELIVAGYGVGASSCGSCIFRGPKISSWGPSSSS